MTETHYIEFGPDGVATGSGFTPDGTLPSGAMSCSAEMAMASRGATLSAGAIVPAAPRPPTLVQQAYALVAGGLTIVSTGTPGINGVYACDAATRATIAEVVTGIAASHGFPGNGPTFDFALADRTTIVTFPTTLAFVTVGVAIRDFVYACFQVINGRSVTLPSATVTVT